MASLLPKENIPNSNKKTPYSGSKASAKSKGLGDYPESSSSKLSPHVAGANASIVEGSGSSSSSSKTSKIECINTLPWPLADEDMCKLRVSTVPLEVEMPVIEGNGSKINSFDIRLETYSYPTWERCRVQKVFGP